MNTIFGDKKLVYNAGVEATTEYLNTDTVHTRTPAIKLLISPYGMPFAPIEIISSDIAGIIQSADWIKSRSNPGGTWHITLSSNTEIINKMLLINNVEIANYLSSIWKELGPDLRDIFKYHSLCQIWINGYHVTTGIVSSCNRTAQVSNNSGRISYELVIDELGNLYMQNILSINTNHFGSDMHILDDLTQTLNQTARIIGLPLHQACNILVNAFLGTFLTSRTIASDGLPLPFRMVASAPPLGGISTTSLMANVVTEKSLFALAGGQSFWDYLVSLITSPFMELFTESGGRTIVTQNGNPTIMFPGFNYLIARSTPYENPMLGVTPHYLKVAPYLLGTLQLLAGGDFIIITDNDIYNKSLGQNGEQQHTIYNVTYSGRGADDASSIHNRPSIATGPVNPFASGGVKSYGIKQYNANISAVSLSGTGLIGQKTQEFQKKIAGTSGMFDVPTLASLLNVWFRNAAKFTEGTITTRAIPYARPGMYLLYLPTKAGMKPECIRDIGIYYIDNVSYSYTIRENDTTTFSVIRGVPLPETIAATAMTLLDWELLPPGTNLFDGEIISRLFR